MRLQQRAIRYHSWWATATLSDLLEDSVQLIVRLSRPEKIELLISFTDGFSLMFLSVIVIARDGNWTPSNGIVYVVFLATVTSHGIIASTLARIMGKLQTVFVIMNFVLIFATIIALPIGQKHRNSGSFIFTHTENLTTWPTGWAFVGLDLWRC